MPVVKIPPVLRAQTGGESQVEVAGSDVGEVLRGLTAAHPGTEKQLFDDGGELNRYVNVYLNDEDVRVLDGLETGVGADDTIVILPAMAGGSGVG
jgi:molybdopterin synthase sulfur carrier subunit